MEATSKRLLYEQQAQGLQGPALIELVSRATEDPGMVHFGGLLALPSVEQMSATAEGAHALELLRLFAYGTWANYIGASDQLGLNDKQKTKLRVLTVLSLAATRRTLQYEQVQEEVGLDSVHSVEDLLISYVVGRGLIQGRLDQSRGSILIEESVPRDVAPKHVDSVAASLKLWLEGVEGLLATLEHTTQETEKAASDVAGKRAEHVAQEQAARRLAAEGASTSQLPPTFDALQSPVETAGLLAGDTLTFAGATPQGARLPKRRR